MLPMTDLCPRSCCFYFLCLGCFCSSPGCSRVEAAPGAGWGPGGVWPCAGLPSAASSTASSRAGSRCIMTSFPETRVSCHNSVSTNKNDLTRATITDRPANISVSVLQGRNTPRATVDMLCELVLHRNVLGVCLIKALTGLFSE